MIKELIEKFDKDVFYFVNSTLKNKTLDIIFPIITRMGEDLSIIAAGILLFILGKRKGKRTAILMMSALFLSRLSVLLIKKITHRPRPSLVYDNVHLLSKSVFSSFPSGHTTLATAICIVLCFKYKKLSPLFIFLAALVGISRLYVGQHYPTDVVAGFALGGLVGFSVIYIEKIFLDNKPKSAN